MVPGGGSLKESVRFWWIRNGERVGLAIVPLLLIVILPFFVPLGRSAPRTGVINRIDVGGAGKLQPAFNAWVAVDGGEIIVGLPLDHRCAVGSVIALRKSRTLSGERYALSSTRCGVAPTPRR